MVKKWDQIFDLRADGEDVHKVQDANVFSSTPYLFGSDEWWAAIDAGSITRRTVEGVIAEVSWSRAGDRPEFRMKCADGSEWTGTRHGDPTRYVEGLAVRLDYVTAERVTDAPGQSSTTVDVVIAVRIEHSHRRTPLRSHSFYPPPPSPI